VHSRLDHPWQIEDMAARIGLGINRFGVLYRQRFGLSPGEDLMCERMRRARMLLTTDDKRIGEIALAVGFQDRSWFSRCFKQRVGCSPRAYRLKPISD